MDDEFLTLKETAKLLKLSINTVYTLVQKKKIPAFKIGGKWRISKKELINYIKSKTITVDEDIKILQEFTLLLQYYISFCISLLQRILYSSFPVEKVEEIVKESIKEAENSLQKQIPILKKLEIYKSIDDFCGAALKNIVVAKLAKGNPDESIDDFKESVFNSIQLLKDEKEIKEKGVN